MKRSKEWPKTVYSRILGEIPNEGGSVCMAKYVEPIYV